MKPRLLLTCFCLLALTSCDQKKSPTKPSMHHVKTVYVNKKQNVNKLFYSGAVQPLQVTTITTPVDGVIDRLNFSYGQLVKTGQMVVKISSSKLQNELHEAVASYIKSKDTFNNSKVAFEGTEQLYKEKIIARREYVNEKAQLESNELSYLEAKFKLQQLISTIPGLNEKLKNVSLSDVKNIRQIFDKKFDEISLYSERNGIVLFPVKKSKESADKEIEVGSEIKKGQALMSVGDLSSLGVEFEVGEMEINKLKPGQSVKVTTPAIPQMQLDGKIYSVAVQAKNVQSFADNAKFPVKVKVDTIPEKFQKELRVGMGVRIEVDLADKSTLSVPISAVKKKEGRAQVQVVDSKTGQKVWRQVQTGATSIKEIRIEKGLEKGEQVVVHDRT